MKMLGKLFPVSQLALGGGGIGQVWGETTRSEAEATVRRAYEGGITLFDMAPSYGDGEAESVLGSCFAEGYPDDIRVTTKCMLGTVADGEIEKKLADSLNASRKRLGREQIDIFILHGYVVETEALSPEKAERLKNVIMPYSQYREIIVPLLNRWKTEGRIGAWGLSSAGTPDTDLKTISESGGPDVVQCITNLLDSAGDMGIAKELPPRHRERIQTASELGVGVMGIRAVAAGALTDTVDRSLHERSRVNNDFSRAESFRALADSWGVGSAHLAHRYALAMNGVDTVVLGVKNRQELDDCIAAAAAPKLTNDEIAEIDRSVNQL